MACYESPDLAFAQQIVAGAARMALQPHAPRIPGAHCVWCPVRESCTAAAAMAASPAWAEHGDAPPTAAELKRYKASENIINARKALAVELVEEAPDAIPGVTLSVRAGRVSISNPKAVFERLIAKGLPADDVLAVASLSKTDILNFVK